MSVVDFPQHRIVRRSRRAKRDISITSLENQHVAGRRLLRGALNFDRHSSKRGDVLNFAPKEALPTECPPDKAAPLSGLFVRLVEGPIVDATFCDSFSAMGKVAKANVDPCVWAACSLIVYDEEWPGGPIARVVDFAKQRRLIQYKKFGAIIRLSPEAGVGIRSTEDSPHYSFWMAYGFQPATAVQDIVSLL